MLFKLILLMDLVVLTLLLRYNLSMFEDIKDNEDRGDSIKRLIAFDVIVIVISIIYCAVRILQC